MSEPKKETVRIVLPPRRDGQPLASSPRETAMINLPPSRSRSQASLSRFLCPRENHPLSRLFRSLREWLRGLPWACPLLPRRQSRHRFQEWRLPRQNRLPSLEFHPGCQSLPHSPPRHRLRQGRRLCPRRRLPRQCPSRHLSRACRLLLRFRGRVRRRRRRFPRAPREASRVCPRHLLPCKEGQADQVPPLQVPPSPLPPRPSPREELV